MIHSLAEKMTDILLQHQVIEGEDCEIYTYGLELIVSNVINLISLLVLTILLGTYIESIVFLVFLIPIRLYAGGYHAKTYFRCNLVFVMIYLLVIGMIQITPTGIMVEIGVLVMCLSGGIIYKFSPVESEYNPLSTDEKNDYAQISRRILGVEMILIIVGFVLGNEWIKFVYVGCLTTLAVAMSIIISILQRRNDDENERKNIS